MSNLDQKVISILETIQNKKEELKESEEINNRKNWMTNCIVNTQEFSNKNLKVMNENDILNFTSFLILKREYQEKAADLLNHSFEIKFNNYSYENWFEDCKKRLDTIIIKDKMKKFEELEKTAEDLQSDDLKRQKALDKILEQLKQFN